MTNTKTVRGSDALADLRRAVADLQRGMPANIFEIPMLGRTWATCLAARAKADQDATALRSLPGLVALGDTEGLVDAKATEDVGALVRLWRAAGAYNAKGFRLLWTYCTGVERLRTFEAVVVGIAGRQVADIANRMKRDETFRRLQRAVRSLQSQVA